MSFRRFLVVRLAWSLLAVFLATVAVFSIFRLFIAEPLPGPTGNNAQPPRLEPYYDRDRLFLVRYGEFIRDFASDGSFGRPYSLRKASRTAAFEAMSVTGSVVLPGLMLALALATLFSLAWARAGPKTSRLWRLPLYLAIGTIPVWLGLVLSFYVGVKLGWLPSQGYCDVFGPGKECGGASEWAKQLTLPWVAFGLFFAAVYARILRTVVFGVLQAKDDDRAEAIRRSVLGMTRAVGRDVGFAVGAAAIVELVFGLPGLGRVSLRSVGTFDLPLAETILLWATLLTIAVHFFVDVIVCMLDSKLRADWPFVYARPASGERA